MHDIFISYSTKDQAQAETVRDILEKNGIPCWMAPRDIPGGSNYTKEIPVAIRSCQVFVLVLSDNAQSSPWVLKELDMAVNCGKVILPFMLEDCQLNDEFNFLLTGAQRYAAYQKKAEAMENLIKRILAVVDAGKTNDTQQASAAPVPDMPEKPVQQEKTTVLEFGRCPACGCEQLKPLNKVGKYVGLREQVYYLWMLIPCAVALLAALLLLGTIGSFLSSAAVWIAGTVIGCKITRKLTDKSVQRLRIRRHIHPHPYQCEKCDWVFLQEESPLG